MCMCTHRFVLGVEECTCRHLDFLTWWTVWTLVTCYKEESGMNMNVFGLTEIDKCSCCLEQSYLFDMVVMVTPWCL